MDDTLRLFASAARPHRAFSLTQTRDMSVQPNYQQRFFVYLVAYRWASLLVPFWALWQEPASRSWYLAPVITFLVAATHTAFVTLFHRPLNRLVLRYPPLLGVDILLSALLIWLSGGVFGPYYLYALSPLLAAAFFFQYRGAVYSAATFTPLYLAALIVHPSPLQDAFVSQTLMMEVAGIWLLPMLVAYPSALLKHLRQAHNALAQARDDLARRHEELQAAHQQLSIIHDLTVSLQAAPDVETVQQRVLAALTDDLGFERAIIGLINPITERLEQWRASPAAAFGPPPSLALPLTAEFAPLTTWLTQSEIIWWNSDAPIVSHPSLNAWIGPGPWIVFPLGLREHTVGVLLIASDVPFDLLPPARRSMLASVAEQAAVVLGTVMLCIDRARRLAIEHERNRIAREMHDSIAQSMFGMVLSLDACIKMLPDHVDLVRTELVDLRNLASRTREQIRQSILDIWPSELTLERFKDDLRKYARHVSSHPFHLEFNTGGDFDGLSPAIRRNLYRIAQEAITNTIRHAGVDTARVCLRVHDGHVYMSVQDRGRGFNLEHVLCREYNRERFGLRGIQERVQALGGTCEIYAQPQAGTLVLVSIPVNGAYAYGK